MPSSVSAQRLSRDLSHVVAITGLSLPALLKVVALIVLAGVIMFAVTLHVLAPEQRLRELALLPVAVIAAATWVLVSRGRVRAGAITLLTGVWTHLTLTAVLLGGASVADIFPYAMTMVGAGVLFGMQAGIGVLLLTALTTLTITVCGSMGLLTAPLPMPLLAEWLEEVCELAFAAALAWFVVRSHQYGLAQISKMQSEIGRFRQDLDRVQAIAEVGSWSYDIERDHAQFSDEACRIFGVPPQTASNLASCLEHIHPEDRSAVAAAWDKAIRLRRPFESEHRLMNGRASRWVHETAEFELSDDGTPLRAVGIVQEITREKRAQEALLLKRMGTEVTSDALFWISSRGRFVDVNPAACNSLGYTREELLQMTVPDIDPDFDRAKWERHFAAMRAGSTSRFESVHRARDGRRFPVEIVCNYLRIDEEEYSCAFVRDVSERHAREAALVAAHRKLAATIDAIPDLMFESDLEGRYHDIHAPHSALLAAPPEQLIGRTVHEVMPRAAADVCMGALREAHALGRSHGMQYELPLQHGGKWFELSVSRKGEATGDDARFIAIARDITQRKRAEEALRRSEVQLQGILGATADGVLAVDRSGRVIQTNRRFAELWRIPQVVLDCGDDGALLDCVVGQLVDPEAFVRKVQELYESDAELVDTVAFRDDRVFERYTAPLMLDQTMVGRVWSFRDITQPKRLEADLRAAEAKLLTILDNVDACIYLKDPAGRYLFANRGVRDVFQAGMEDIVGCSDEKFFDAPTAANIRANDRRVLELGETLRTEEVNTAMASAQTVVYASTKLPLRAADGSIYALCGISIDVTARKKAAIELAEREAQLRTLIESIPDIVQFKDADGRWLVANTVCLRTFGLVGTDWQGMTDAEIAARWPELAADIMAFGASDESAWTDGPMRGSEERVIGSDGTMTYLDIVKVAVFDDVGRRHAMVVIGRDVTERTRAQRNLNMAVEVTQVMLWELDLPSGELRFDHSLLPILGLDAGETVDTLQSWATRVHPDDRAAFEDSLQRAMRLEGSVFDLEFRLADRAGGYQWLHTRGRVTQREAEGQPLLAVGTSMNISARKQAQEDLRASEERSRQLAALLRLMCDNVPDMIWAKDLEMRFLFANKAMCAHLLNARDTYEPVGRTDLFFARREREAHPGDPRWHTFGELCQDSDVLTLEKNQNCVFEEYGHIKGRMVYLDVHKAPFRDEQGEVIGTVGSARDITERRKIQNELDGHRHRLEELVQERTQALLDTEARASLILQSSADGLYGVDCDGVITFINPAACAMLGYEASQAVGRSAHELFHHSRPDGSHFPAEDCPGQEAFLAGKPRRVDNEVYWHADGHAVPVMYAIHPMVQNGAHTGAVVSFVDITEQRAAQQAREEALAAAENLARVRREFLANMSHEIRTPLNGVLGFAQIGHRNHLDGEKARTAFEKILTSGKLLLGIIDDILDFSKIEAGKITVERARVDIGELFEEVFELVAERARSKRIKLQIETAPDLPHACISDGLRLRQVLINLLSNAVKFTDAGTVVLAAALEGSRIVFRVADTGIGMTAEQLDRLFHPFQQADGSMTRKYGGTGLGLAISKRILELLGGEISVESAPGAGSTFTVRLPYVASEEDVRPRGGSIPAQSAALARPLAGISILAAEDDPINQALLEEVLLANGARLVLAGSGREAVDQVRRASAGVFHVVLMDIQMPDMDGYEATREILRLQPGLPVIGQSAHALREEQDNCLSAGMVAYLVKPLNIDELVQVVRRFGGAAI